MDLKEIRNKIDSIDDQLLDLFLQRMECSKQVAEYKVANNIPVLNAQRESEILDKVASDAGDYAEHARLLYSTIMDISRSAQYPYVCKNNSLNEVITSATNTEFAPKIVGCQGTIGAYSEQAALTLYPDCEIKYYPTFEQVFKAIENGEVDCGVLPVENSCAGSVVENYDLLMKYDMYINQQVDLSISHCIAACPNADMGTIKTVFSHEQALNQCADFITEHAISPHSMRNTAIAAEYVANKGDDTLAAICSERCADVYSLKILHKNIQTSSVNTTRFVVVSKSMSIKPDASHISVAFTLPHIPGALYRVLSKLAAFNLNLTKIESRPVKTSLFEYLFYLDFNGNLLDEKTASLLASLNEEMPQFKLFGNY
ncbi:MAG: prephenate dehydratase [Clostridia bacterium]|nr:prephenate dehydratase [Clostridia bacterium]